MVMFRPTWTRLWYCWWSLSSIVRIVRASDVIVTNNAQCTTVGRDLLTSGASIEQTYVAVSLCEGLVHPMDSGIGGGFQALIHHDRRRDYYLMSREYSPYNESFRHTPFVLGNSVGVPAVLAGYAKLIGVGRCVSAKGVKGNQSTTSLHRRVYEYDGECVNRVLSGRLASGIDPGISGVPYSEIFAPVIRLARKGFVVSKTLNDVLDKQGALPLFLRLTRLPTKRRVTNERLAVFLEHLSQNPLSLMDPYVRWNKRQVPVDQDVRSIMLNDVRTFGSLLTERDFLSYRAAILKPLTVSFTDRGTRYKLSTMPSPAGGETIAFFVKMLERTKQLRARENLTDIQLSCLFVLLSKYAFAVKPYFRQWTTKKRRIVILRDAPLIAEKMYRDLLVRTSDASLVNYLVSEIPGIPTRFGRTVVPEIRVAVPGQRTRASELRRNETSDTTTKTTTSATPEETTIEQLETEDWTAIDDVLYDYETVDTTNTDEDYSDSVSRVIDDLARTQEILPSSTEATSATEFVSSHRPGEDHDLTDETYVASDMDGYLETISGTTNVIVKRGNRSIVATSSINHSFGSLIFSQNLGIPYNNVLRDFTPYTWYLTQSSINRDRTVFEDETDQSSKNATKKRLERSTQSRPQLPKKQTKRGTTMKNHPRPKTVPQSSMACTIISNTDTGFPVFGIGAAGGFKITSAIMNVMWNYFVRGDSLSVAVNRLRLTTKLNYKTRQTELWHEFPVDSVYYRKLIRDIGLLFTGPTYEELNFDESNSNPTRNAYHTAHAPHFFYQHRNELQVKYMFEAGYSAVTAFSTLGENKPKAMFDPRRGGSVYVRE